MWAALLSIVSIESVIMILSLFFGPTVVGLYAMGYRLVGMPTRVMGTAVASVFYQEAAVAYHEGELDKVVLTTFSSLVNLGLFPFAILMGIAPDLFEVVFGPQWREAGVFTQILAFWQFSVFVEAPMFGLFNILGRQGVALFATATLLALRAGALMAGGILGDPRLALVMFSAIGGIGLICMLVFLLRASGVTFNAAFGAIRGCLIMIAAMVGGVLAIHQFVEMSPYVLLGITAILSIGYYGFQMRFNPSVWSIVQNTVRRSGASKHKRQNTR